MRLLLIVTFTLLSVSLAFSDKNPLYEGFSFIEKGEYQRSFSIFSSIKSDTPQRYTGMGISKYMEKDYVKAIGYLETALKSKEESKKWVTNYFAALSLFELKRYKEAIQYFEKVIREKKLPDAIFKMAVCYEMVGDLETAIKLLGATLELEPKLVEAYIEMADIFIKQNKLSEAQTVVDKGLSVFNDNPSLIYQKAKLLFMSGKLNEAEKELERAMKLEKDTKISGLYSTIQKSKNTMKKDVMKKKAEEDVNFNFIVAYKEKLVIAGVVVCFLVLIVFSGFYSSRKRQKERLEYLLELLKKKDVTGAEEVLSQISVSFIKMLPLLNTKLFVLKKDFDNAISNCIKIRDNEKRMLLEGLIYCYFGKKEDLKRHITIIESAGLNKNVDLLKVSSFEDKEVILSKILEI